MFDAFFRGGPLLLEESFGASPEAEGETAAPKAGDEGELGALEPHEGSGLHASPLESVGTRRFARTSAGEREALREIGEAMATALPVTTARRAVRARRGRCSTSSACSTKRTAQAARCCASRGATVRRARAAC